MKAGASQRYIVWSSLRPEPKSHVGSSAADAAKKFYDCRPLSPPLFNSDQVELIFAVSARCPGEVLSFDIRLTLTATGSGMDAEGAQQGTLDPGSGTT